MKKILIIVASCWTLGASLPAVAGPDFNAIEQARKAKQSAHQAEQAKTRGEPASTSSACPPGDLILPLDHGPRAQTTPYANRLRQERYASQMQACKVAGRPVTQ